MKFTKGVKMLGARVNKISKNFSSSLEIKMLGAVVLHSFD